MAFRCILNSNLSTLSTYSSGNNQRRESSSTSFEREKTGEHFRGLFTRGHQDTYFWANFDPRSFNFWGAEWGVNFYWEWCSSIFPFEWCTVRPSRLIIYGDIGAPSWQVCILSIEINVKIATFSFNASIFGNFRPNLTLSISNNYSKILILEKSIFVKIGPRMQKLFNFKVV